MYKSILFAVGMMFATGTFAQGSFRVNNESTETWRLAVKTKYKYCYLAHTTGNSCNAAWDEQNTIGWYSIAPGQSFNFPVGERGTCITAVNAAGTEYYYDKQQRGILIAPPGMETLNATSPFGPTVDLKSYADPGAPGKVRIKGLLLNGVPQEYPMKALSSQEVLNYLVSKVMLPFKCTLVRPGASFVLRLD